MTAALTNAAPFCPTCQQYMRVLRVDGTMMNHRDADEGPCSGSRQSPDWRTPLATKTSGPQAWRWLGSNKK